jgi:hypothetical protein
MNLAVQTPVLAEPTFGPVLLSSVRPYLGEPNSNTTSNVYVTIAGNIPAVCGTNVYLL